MGSVQLTINL